MNKFYYLLIWGIFGCLLLLAQPGGAVDWESQMEIMIRNHLEKRGIQNSEVLKAMRRTPRHLMIPPRVQSFAYADRPLPIGEGQTISQPYVVALMTELLEALPGMKVLEIGTGSGYQAAVLQAMKAEVYSIEIINNLAKLVKPRLKKLNIPVKVKNADGYFGWKEHAPFDRIIITAAANHIPRPLLNQLKPGGKLILPLGNTRFFQTLTVVTLDSERKTSVVHYDQVRFVPMTGEAQK
jgi:protein-L-isoaspartate(D-aspartate) O-methyltransferase